LPNRIALGAGPVWDAFWMLNALWSRHRHLVAYGYADPESSPLDLLYFGLTALFWLGHRFCSTYLPTARRRTATLRTHRSALFASDSNHDRMFCLLSPADLALPWTRAERLVGWRSSIIMGDLAFPRSISGALTLSFTRRTRRLRADRRFDRFFAVSVVAVSFFVADISPSGRLSDQWIIGVLPAWMFRRRRHPRWRHCLLMIVDGAALFAELRTSRWSYRVLYIIGIAIMVGIALRREIVSFLVLGHPALDILATPMRMSHPCSATNRPCLGASRALRLHASGCENPVLRCPETRKRNNPRGRRACPPLSRCR